jgi:phospholipase/carboxylesterase
MYTHDKQIVTAGVPLNEAKRALIIIHGRGGTAAEFLSLAKEFNLINTAVLAPQATNRSWYPYSFLAPVEDNQPALDSALGIIGEVVDDILAGGIPLDQVYFMGFSQGACLASEYVTRNARKYGGVIAFTGGLIGEELNESNYKGDFDNTPFLLTTGDPDPHVPLSRAEESVAIITSMNASITFKVYKGRPHTITMEEVELAQNVFH